MMRTLSFSILFLSLSCNIVLAQENAFTIVENFVKGRNRCDSLKINKLIVADYQEIFINGELEVIDKADFLSKMTWFKVVNSRGFIEHIELRDSTIVSIEKYTNMLDVILKREPRTFKITYFLEGDKIHHQIIDTLNGYNALLKRNNEKLDLFNNFCMDNSYEFSMKMNQKDGQKLKRLLHLYRKENLE